MIKFQVIENLKSNIVLTELTSEQIAEVIRAGGGLHGVPCYKQAIIALRNEKNEAKQKEIKASQLPAFIPSVSYTNNSRAAGEQYAIHQYMMLDIDGKDNPALAKQGVEFTKLLPGELVFVSPKGDGRKVLVAVHLRNEYDYQTAYTQITTGINTLLTSRNKAALTFDKNAAKITQLCLFSWDKFAVYGDETAVMQPNYGGLTNKPQRGASSVLSEADWSTVDTSTVANLFASTVAKLAAAGTVWGNGTYAFLFEIIRLKLHGVTLPELVSLVHQHANGKYTAKHPKQKVTERLTRLYNELFAFVEHATMPAPATNSFVFNQYLTEHLGAVWQHIQQKGTVYIDAPTGAGKTSLIRELAKLSGLTVDLLCPTTALAQQQRGDGVLHVTGDGMLQVEHYGASVLACCYESIAKVKKRQADILVIDEAHELASAYNYRSKAIQTISEYLDGYKYVVYLSGSMFPIVNDANADNVLTFRRKQAKHVSYNLVTLDKGKDADYFIANLKANTLNVFYKNDRTQLAALKDYLETAGKQVLLIHADNKTDSGYQGLITDSTLAKYDVVLTTCLLQSGVNVNDSRAVNIVFGSGCSVLDYIQFTARFRAVTPTVDILHAGKVGALYGGNEAATRQQIEATIAGLSAAKKINENLPMNQKSFFKPVLIDGTRVDENGEYQIDNYYLLFKRYELLNNNAKNNKVFLQNLLKQFGFDFQKHVVTNATELLKETETEHKQLSKDRRELIAAGLVDGTYMLSKAAGKEERELYQRWQRLNRLQIWSVTAPMLTSSKEYSRTVERALYEHCEANTAQGFALSEKAAVWFNKLNTVKQQVTPGTVEAEKLKAIVQAATGRTGNEAVNEVVGLMYDVTRKRVRNGQSRSYEYVVSTRKAKDLTKRVGIAISDDFFDLN